MRLPNRKERRAFNKKNKTNHTLQDFALMRAINGVQQGEDISWLKPYLPVDLVPHKDNWELFPDGTVVKLNYEGIMARPPKYLSDEFKAWVEENKDEQFKIFRDPEDENRKGLLGLHYEDETKDTDFSKALLFDMYSDLLAWDKIDNDFVNPQRVEDRENEIANVKQSLIMCDSLEVEVSEEEYKKIEDIRKALENQENGTSVIADPLEWQNMDSILQAILDKEIPSSEEEVDSLIKDVVEENTTKGGEE